MLRTLKLFSPFGLQDIQPYCISSLLVKVHSLAFNSVEQRERTLSLIMTATKLGKWTRKTIQKHPFLIDCTVMEDLARFKKLPVFLPLILTIYWIQWETIYDQFITWDMDRGLSERHRIYCWWFWPFVEVEAGSRSWRMFWILTQKQLKA